MTLEGLLSKVKTYRGDYDYNAMNVVLISTDTFDTPVSSIKVIGQDNPISGRLNILTTSIKVIDRLFCSLGYDRITSAFYFLAEGDSPLPKNKGKNICI